MKALVIFRFFPALILSILVPVACFEGGISSPTEPPLLPDLIPHREAELEPTLGWIECTNQWEEIPIKPLPEHGSGPFPQYRYRFNPQPLEPRPEPDEEPDPYIDGTPAVRREYPMVVEPPEGVEVDPLPQTPVPEPIPSIPCEHLNSPCDDEDPDGDDDNDGIPNHLDPDNDNDGIPDQRDLDCLMQDACNDPTSEQWEFCHDDPNNPDDDEDGIPDEYDPDSIDSDGDGISRYMRGLL